MEKAVSTQYTDIIQGKVYRGKKWDPTTKKFVKARFFNVAIYVIDSTGQPVQIGTRELKNKEVVPVFQIAKVFRIAESSLLKVASDESNSCNLYWSIRR